MAGTIGKTEVAEKPKWPKRKRAAVLRKGNDMQRFEYLVRSDFDQMAEDASRSYGSKEEDRTKAYAETISRELNKLGVEGWELVQAPDQFNNHNWIFKRAIPD